MFSDLAVPAAFVFVLSAVARRLEETAISGAIVFVSFDIVCGPIRLDLVNLDVDAEGIRTLAELTLALVLFTDAP